MKYKTDKDKITRIRKLLKYDSNNDQLFHTKSRTYGEWLSDIVGGRTGSKKRFTI